MSRHRFYRLFGAGLLLVVIWCSINFKGVGILVCPFRAVTGLPCPSCGSTRALIMLMHGRFHETLLTNPLVYVLVTTFSVCVAMFMYDLLFSANSLQKLCTRMVEYVKHPKVYRPLFMIIALLWIFNLRQVLGL